MNLVVTMCGYQYDLRHDHFQLLALQYQTNHDFEIFYIDPYKSPQRRDLLKEFSEETKIKTIWMPYSLPPMPRRYDWACWNTPFLICDAERIFRYQQGRLISRNLIQFIHENEGNLAFQRYHIDRFILGVSIHERNGNLFSLTSNGYTVESNPQVKNQMDYPGFCYGDWCLKLNDYIELNGIDEVSTSLCHYEDADMEMRWKIAYRLGRVSNVALVTNAVFRVDDSIRCDLANRNFFDYKLARYEVFGWVKNCDNCLILFMKLSYNDPDPALQNLKIEEKNGQEWYKCNLCGGVFHKQSHPHFSQIKIVMENQGLYRGTIGVDGRFGRHLIRIREDCMKLGHIQDRVDLVNKSWLEERYLG